MPSQEFFFERVTSEIHQQMEGVLALAERLARQPLGADAQSCVAGVIEACVNVRQIVASSMDLRNAAATGIELNLAPHRLRDLVDDLEARWGARARASGVTLLVAYDGDPEASALIDAPRTIQAFDGLIAQALAGVRRGAVEATLKAAQDGDVMRIEGRVRGGGDRNLGARALDIREIEALFGLEIALASALGRTILTALGGHIRADDNRGGGETLVFDFQAACVLETPADNGTAGGEDGRSAHILVVDDNATNRMVAETLCEMFDCTSESAVDGVEAVEVAKSGRFDLILMDIKMPRMDGVTATREIRQFAGHAGRVPIIALTANADPEDAAGYLSAGMNGVVEKPMKPENLLRALQENLGGGAQSAAA
ncbi:response regulator [Phenylobacterium aquaticum]|uniref:response regulator n=1 Tax=Phenylobacterium aquaticum TaxID=1763816 RepID=UPI0026F2778D|nr:response regulator [Phenylobacterium aquaticum]